MSMVFKWIAGNIRTNGFRVSARWCLNRRNQFISSFSKRNAKPEISLNTRGITLTKSASATSAMTLLLLSPLTGVWCISAYPAWKRPELLQCVLHFYLDCWYQARFSLSWPSGLESDWTKAGNSHISSLWHRHRQSWLQRFTYKALPISGFLPAAGWNLQTFFLY